MINYSLKCSRGHQFDSWFSSAEGFSELLEAGMLECPVCGDPGVEKSMMAPAVNSPRSQDKSEKPGSGKPEPAGPLSKPMSPAEAAIKKLREKISGSSEYVGKDFAREARAIHDGDAAERPIYGEASGKEAAELMSDGIPILPLPFKSAREVN